MTAQAETPIAELLLHLGEGADSLDAVGTVLSQHEPMQLLVAAAELARAMAANVEPESYAIHSADGQNPLVFTDGDIAHRCAVDNGWVRPDKPSACFTKGWISGVRQILWRGDAGMVIDHGASHRMYFDNLQLSALYAAMTVEWLATLEGLYILSNDGETVKLQENEHGSRMMFAFDTAQSVELGLEKIRAVQPQVTVMGLTTAATIRVLLENDVEMLVVNHGVGDERTYLRRHIERMSRID